MLTKTIVLTVYSFMLSIEVPQDYTSQTNTGPDFTVAYVNPSGQSDLITVIGIYIGYHPNPFFKEGKSVKKKGVVGTRDITWTEWQIKRDGQRLYKCETLIEDFFDKKENFPMVLHLFLTASTPEGLEKLKKTVATLRLSKKG